MKRLEIEKEDSLLLTRVFNTKANVASEFIYGQGVDQMVDIIFLWLKENLGDMAMAMLRHKFVQHKIAEIAKTDKQTAELVGRILLLATE
jgi:hypothetical protein